MESQEYLVKKKKLYNAFLEFINQNENYEENFQNLFNILDDHKINKDKDEFELFLHLVNNVSNNHFRTNNFFAKIEKILLLFQNQFNNFLTNEEIYNIFGTNKRILLFLVENKIIQLSQPILQFINKNYKKNQYLEYFSNEIQTTSASENSEDQNDSNFDINRKIGENEELLCKIIRNDLISDFIIYVNRNELSLIEKIEKSIFETNLLLNNKSPTLIEYSAFFGSIQIFKYLFKNNVELTPSLWIYAIHGANPEIIQILEENKIDPENKDYKKCMVEAINCHHNEIAYYIQANFLQNEFDLNDIIVTNSIKCNNYEFFPDDLFNQKYFYYLCKYNYLYFVEQILRLKKIDINIKIKDTLDVETLIFTPLLAAIHNNCFKITSVLLKQPNIDVNIIGYRIFLSMAEITENALSLSIRKENIQIIRLLLLNEKLNFNEVLTDTRYYTNLQMDYAEYCPLFLAISSNNTQMIRELLSHPNFDINKKIIFKKYQMGPSMELLQSLKRSFLHIAIISNKDFLTRLLVNDPKIDINNILRMEKGGKIIKETPLCTAMIRKNEDIIKLILSHPKIDVNIPLITITPEKNEKFIKYPLYIAIKDKDINTVKLLLSNPKININQISTFVFSLKKETNYTPLILAIRNSNQQIVSLLLSNSNIDVNLYTNQNLEGIKYKQNPLSLAIFLKEIEIVKLLLNHRNINVNLKYIFKSSKQYYEERNNFVLAIQNNDEKIVNLLLNHPYTDVNVKDICRLEDNTMMKTAILHTAILNNNINIITSIINSHKIDVNITSYSKKKKNNAIIEKKLPTFYYAIKSKKLELVKLLLSKNNFDVSLKSIKTVMSTETFYIEEKTPLQMAVFSKNVEIFLCILDYLQKNNKITDNLNELMKMASDSKIKSIIYNNISK